MNNKAKRLTFIALTIFALAAALCIGPLDVFTHGFYSDAPDPAKLPEQSTEETVDIMEVGYTVTFMPLKKHFRGFQLYMLTPPQEGTLDVTIYSQAGEELENATVPLSRPKAGAWYMVYMGKKLRPRQQYQLSFTAEGYTDIPQMQLVAGAHLLQQEALENGLLVGYGYRRPTFSFTDKTLIICLIIAGWLLAAAAVLAGGRIWKRGAAASLFLALTAVMAWNFMNNSMDQNNTSFPSFQKDSEGLVTGLIQADKNGIPITAGLGRVTSQNTFSAYDSQFGLQGRSMKHIARHLDYATVFERFNLLCSVLTAATFVILVFLLKRKYGLLLAACFYATFWLSPWVVNFARNLYWVEFTWFLPMAAGLFLSLHYDRMRLRAACYGALFAFTAAKCLCGYEYISSVMLAGITFPLADCVESVRGKDRPRSRMLARAIFCAGCAMLLGFAAALCIHARTRGDTLLAGMRSIFERDVLRRTHGGDMNNFDPVYWSSFNASAWEVLCKYFHFSTDVVAGIPGNLFPLLSAVPLAIFAWNIRKRLIRVRDMALYGLFFLTAASWYVLGKSHSYIHTHMNYVLWYFGFVQLCLYVIARQAYSFIRGAPAANSNIARNIPYPHKEKQP